MIAAGLLIAGAPATAVMYSCRDASGAPLLQSSTDGCVTEICEIKANGGKDCEETKAQRTMRESREQRESECKTTRRRAMLKELTLLDRFRKRGDIDTERDKELAANRRDIDSARQEQERTRRTLAQLTTQAEFYGPKHPMPGKLRDDIAYNTKHLEELGARQSKAEADTGRINEHYDELLKHYDRLLKDEYEHVPCDGD